MKSIVIVGGGFGAWYTAAALRLNLENVHITVIDSDRVGRLGVGETLGWSGPHDFRKLLHLEDDAMMMWKTGASYKYATQLVDFWQDQRTFTQGKFFNTSVSSLSRFYGSGDFHDFVEPWNRQAGDVGIMEAWMSLNQHTNKTFEDYIEEVNEAVAFGENTWAPYDRNNRYVLRPNDGWSYHLDAEQTVEFCRELATRDNDQLLHLNKTVVEVEQQDGVIKWIQLEDQTVVYGDLFIDATGFSRVLVKQVNPTWRSSDERINNAAWVCPTFYRDPAKEMKGSTQLYGEDHGWRFLIQLYHRAGQGYVFNSQNVDPEIPRQRLESLTQGCQIRPPRLIQWEPGFYQTPWIGNTIALGISGGFIDPYDAPAFDVHSRGLEDLINYWDSENLDMTQTQFNQNQARVVKEREARLICSFGVSQRRGDWWQQRRDLMSDTGYSQRLNDIMNQTDKDTTERLKWFWQQPYYTMVLAAGYKRDAYKFPELTTEQAEMAHAFFNYNRLRNKFVRSQSWPNYYNWLRMNRFHGHSSKEIFEMLNGK